MENFYVFQLLSFEASYWERNIFEESGVTK